MEIFRSSARNCRNIRALAVTALLMALNFVLDRFSIQLTLELRVGVGFLTSAMIGALYGPVMAMCAGGLTDILSYLLYPRGGAYFPGFTVTAIVAGLIYGLLLYQKRLSLGRALVTRGLIDLVTNIGLNTLWLSITQGKAMMVLLPARVIKNAILWPFGSLILFAVGAVVLRAAAQLPAYSQRRARMDK